MLDVSGANMMSERCLSLGADTEGVIKLIVANNITARPSVTPRGWPMEAGRGRIDLLTVGLMS